MGLFLACACLMGICTLPEAPIRFERDAARPPVALAVTEDPRPTHPVATPPSAPLAERAVPTDVGSPPDGPVPGEPDKLSRAAITEVVQQKTGAIKRCYERALVEDETYGGTVEIGWKIQTDGQVTAATVIDAAKRNTTAENCLVAEILTWRFPPASEPTAVGVYPFVLNARLLTHHAPHPSPGEAARNVAATIAPR